MPIISMAIARQHLRDPDDDDEYLAILVDAAERAAMDYLNRKFYADEDSMAVAIAAGEAGDSPMLINPVIKAACLLMLGHLYSNREDEVTGTIVSDLSLGSRALLTPYRVGWGI
ncbi:head-tail connector protein [Pseudomonas sp. GD03860]|uniref:head-tail connector protein n=1 Tax=Pseudomonas sp. GD03860 TaxID=2975389 RepID=UPI00244A5B74|nr:head-tail connector protein [Pseudomonas sp. GD03860]MDH0640158.1 head-tail connector protein [Pseudomonas sp. GD03860]